MQRTEKHEDITYILDEVTMRIVDLLLDHPTIPYNKAQLAEQAGVSRDALYRRWDTLVAFDIVKESTVRASGTYWELNQNSNMVDAIARILHEQEE